MAPMRASGPQNCGTDPGLATGRDQVRRRDTVEILSDLVAPGTGPVTAPGDPAYEPAADGPLDGKVGKDRQFVTSLARGLEVLRAFREGEQLLGNQEIAQRTGLPKPTVSRLTYTLTRLGYLTYSRRLGKYQVGAAALTLGYHALANMGVRRLARPLLQQLADDINASVALGSRDRLDMVYIECCRPDTAITLRLDVGSRVPLATTAMGRAFLAALPEDERTYLMGFLRLRYRHRWPSIRDTIESARRDYEKTGFCLSLGEWQREVNAAGVPLCLPDGSSPMALNCGGPAFMIGREKLETCVGPRLVEIAGRIRAMLGWS